MRSSIVPRWAELDLARLSTAQVVSGQDLAQTVPEIPSCHCEEKQDRPTLDRKALAGSDRLIMVTPLCQDK
jgi:hypothetical protein